MKIYAVGGAVRDALLGLPVKDRDWVVVGATPEEMLAGGYVAVGRDFPVFLHPVTHEEYALARTERKTAPGYAGFVFHTAPGVTLEEDLRRRDLTINAIAQAENGELIDPYGGRADLASRVLRHVSPAFAEDPVRILRVARLAARFADFTVAPETLALMQQMVAAGEVDALVPERVWQELSRGLMEATPSRMFAVLRECGALHRLLPEVDALWGVPQRRDCHPEIDAGVHVMLVIDLAARLAAPLPARFAALTHDLGLNLTAGNAEPYLDKGVTPAALLPRHYGHEQKGVELLESLCARLRVPADCRDVARLAARFHGDIHRAAELRPATVLRVLQGCDALRRPERFELVLLACEAAQVRIQNYRGRLGCPDTALHSLRSDSKEVRDYPAAGFWRRALVAVRAVDARAIAQDARSMAHAEENPSAATRRITDGITNARIAAIKAVAR